MGFWKRKELTRLTSDEYEKLNNKFVSLSGELLVANNNLEILRGNWRKLSAKVAIVAKEVTASEAESDLKGDVLAI